MILSYYQDDQKGLKIHLKVIPNSSGNEICGITCNINGQQLLKIKITALADKGKANKALIKFISKEWDIPSSNIKIISGYKSQIKKIMIINYTDQCLSRLKIIQKLTSVV
jgi:uncharacterized protein (TIGR00251 family)